MALRIFLFVRVDIRESHAKDRSEPLEHFIEDSSWKIFSSLPVPAPPVERPHLIHLNYACRFDSSAHQGNSKAATARSIAYCRYGSEIGKTRCPVESKGGQTKGWMRTFLLPARRR